MFILVSHIFGEETQERYFDYFKKVFSFFMTRFHHITRNYVTRLVGFCKCVVGFQCGIGRTHSVQLSLNIMHVCLIRDARHRILLCFRRFSIFLSNFSWLRDNRFGKLCLHLWFSFHKLPVWEKIELTIDTLLAFYIRRISKKVTAFIRTVPPCFDSTFGE